LKKSYCLAMAPYYRHVCSELGNKIDQALLSSLTEKNQTDIQALEAKIKDAEENLGESELAEALLQKAQYLAKIGDKVNND
jgi:26S proteasome regulatory subunit N7